MQRKEIMELRRQDHAENLQRRAAFHNLVKDKLQDTLYEKQARGELLMREQQKLKDLSYKQRATFKGYHSMRQSLFTR